WLPALRVRSAAGRQRRCLRPLPGEAGRDAREPEDHRTVPAQHAGRAPQGRPSADHAAAEGTHAAAHRDADHPLPAGLLGAGDASTMSYLTRIRTASFPHLQQIPSVINGSIISDLIAYLGSIDFVIADVDR